MKVLLAYSVEVEALKTDLVPLCPEIEFFSAPTYKEATETALKIKPGLVISHMLFDSMVIKDGKVVKSAMNAQPGTNNVTDLFKFIKRHPALAETLFVIYTLGDLTMARESCPGAAAYIIATQPHSLKQLADTIQKAAY